MKKNGDWQEAVHIFLESWIHRKEFVGALACESYVTGNPSDNSDIDFHIILSNKIYWRTW